jgi:hypothetical protein
MLNGKLSNAQSMYVVYKAGGAPDQEDSVILVMKLPDRNVLTFAVTTTTCRTGENKHS